MDIKTVIGSFCQDKRVIVVGNSKRLLEKPNGPLIDSFDVVVRLNHGYPRQQWEPFLGRRTDIWVCGFNDQARQIREYSLFRPRFAVRLNNETHVHPRMKAVFWQWEMANWREVQKAAGITKYPSTGLVTIYFFLKYLELSGITITGFDFFRTPNFYHSAGGRPQPASRWHSPHLEQAYVNRLVENGSVTVLV